MDFLTLARTVAQETADQEEFHAELLSGLWARMLGPRAKQLQKFKRNHLLLHDVRQKTLLNKKMLASHHSVLIVIEKVLMDLRGKLAFPLLVEARSPTAAIDEQRSAIISVLDGISTKRTDQRSKVRNRIFAVNRSRQYGLYLGDNTGTIESGQH